MVQPNTPEQPLWTPRPAQVNAAQITAFRHAANARGGGPHCRYGRALSHSRHAARRRLFLHAVPQGHPVHGAKIEGLRAGHGLNWLPRN